MTDPIVEQDPKLAEIVRRLVVAYQPEHFVFHLSRAPSCARLSLIYNPRASA